MSGEGRGREGRRRTAEGGEEELKVPPGEVAGERGDHGGERGGRLLQRLQLATRHAPLGHQLRRRCLGDEAVQHEGGVESVVAEAHLGRGARAVKVARVDVERAQLALLDAESRQRAALGGLQRVEVLEDARPVRDELVVHGADEEGEVQVVVQLQAALGVVERAEHGERLVGRHARRHRGATQLSEHDVVVGGAHRPHEAVLDEERQRAVQLARHRRLGLLRREQRAAHVALQVGKLRRAGA